jgi:hypothetical protein
MALLGEAQRATDGKAAGRSEKAMERLLARARGAVPKKAASMGANFRAPSRLKSRIYSALLKRQQDGGPLLRLSQVKAGGRKLCVFEELVHIASVSDPPNSQIFAVYAIRALAENIEKAPLYWRGCPYAQFQNR